MNDCTVERMTTAGGSAVLVRWFMVMSIVSLVCISYTLPSTPLLGDSIAMSKRLFDPSHDEGGGPDG